MEQHAQDIKMPIEFPFFAVEGFLSQEDRVNLRDLALRCSAIRGNFIEVGSYKGLSALCILEGMRGRPIHHGQLVCMDWFEPEKLEQFNKNIEAVWGDVFCPVVLIQGDFKKTEWEMKWQTAFVFVDHSHTLDDTIAAHKMFWPKIEKGGILAFHDFGHPDWPEATDYLRFLPYHRVLDGSILAFLKE